MKELLFDLVDELRKSFPDNGGYYVFKSWLLDIEKLNNSGEDYLTIQSKLQDCYSQVYGFILCLEVIGFIDFDRKKILSDALLDFTFCERKEESE